MNRHDDVVFGRNIVIGEFFTNMVTLNIVKFSFDNASGIGGNYFVGVAAAVGVIFAVPDYHIFRGEIERVAKALDLGRNSFAYFECAV